MVKYKISDIAQSDMEAVAQYLVSNNAETAAERLTSEFYSKYERLSEFPLSGTPLKIKRLKRFRFSIVEKYYIFYTFKDNLVTIERILHTARNVKTILKKEVPR